jgi:hypothetical protein
MAIQRRELFRGYGSMVEGGEMSDVMLIGVLRMPIDYPPDEIIFTQIVSRCREAADRIEKDKTVRQKIWDVVGECGNDKTDRQKIDEIESILLDSEELLD